MSAAWPLWLVLAAGADGGTAFVWQLPAHVVSDVDVVGQLEAGGIPVKLRKLTVKLTPAEVGEHFRRSFIAQGLYVPPGMPYDRVLTGVRPDDLHTFTVLIQAADAQHSGVILGEAHPLAAKQRPIAGPLFPGATNALETRFESGRTVSFRARATEAELSSFYAEVLPKEGFTRAASGSWRSATEELSILSQPEARQPGVLRVVMVRQTVPPDDAER
jgi:hypothetical protein